MLERLTYAWLDGRLTDEQKADFVKVLETAYERDRWDGDVDRLAARWVAEHPPEEAA